MCIKELIQHTKKATVMKLPSIALFTRAGKEKKDRNIQQ